MRLKEVMEAKTESKKGTYAGVRFDDDTVSKVKAFAVQNEIPNRVPKNKMHTTVLYSRKYLPDYKAAEKTNMIGKPVKFEKWLAQPDEKDYRASCLVLTYDCPELVDRHKNLMDEHNATFDYETFKPHVTLSYDVGREFDTKKLNPSDIGDLNIVDEYQEDLNLDWAKDNT